MSSDINIIQKRRSIYPVQYTNQKIEDEVIWQILMDANNAPSHKNTEPWRFKVYTEDALAPLGELLAKEYKETVSSEKYSELKYNKTKKKPTLASHVVAISMKRHEESGLPEWEEVAAVSCSVQNIYLSCTMRNLGCYWSSPKTICGSKNVLNLPDGEKCLGLIYIGVPKEGLVFNLSKGDVKEKTTWVRS